MIILSIRSDKPEAEVGLFEDNTELTYKSWQAHRELAETILATIKSLLQVHKKTWSDISGIIVYQGPGSFTGLRIGISLANALAYSNDVPIVGATGDNWLQTGSKAIMLGKGHKYITPHYGSAAHITMPRK